MRTRVAIVYNEPYPSRYGDVGEEKAVLGVLEAVEAGEATTKGEDGTGFVVIASDYEPGKNDDEMKVVYKENADDVEVQVFPYICIKRLATV